MARNFLREYELRIIGDSIISIKELRVQFEIERSAIGVPNKAKIVIYNPSDKTIAAIKRYSKVSLSAGYENNTTQIFSGEVRNAFQQRLGVDKILTIFSADGSRDYMNARVNKTFSENVDVKTVVEDIISNFSTVIKGELKGLDKPADKLRGQAISGSAAKVLDKLSEDYGFDWSIQDGEIITLPVGEPLDSGDIILINSRTGMIGSPAITEIGADATMLMNGKLVPNGLFQIESISADLQFQDLFFREIRRTNAEGLYRAQTVTHTGDTHGDEWSTMVTGLIHNV